MRKMCGLTLGVLLAAGSYAGADDGRTAIVTASNGANNQLLVYDTAGTLVQAVPTQGQGGASSNAGGIATRDGILAVVNFESNSVSIFGQGGTRFVLRRVIPTVAHPASVAFGHDHLYVLGGAAAESYRIRGAEVDADADGSVALVRADGSAAQIGVAGDQVVITEKSGAIEVADVRGGALAGAATAVQIPPGSDTPLGLVTRGANAYVTIAHSDEITLVKHGQLVALTATGSGFPNGPGQQAPCWLALVGPYLFSSNSPSHSISRLIATGNSIILDEPLAAQTLGAPTDIAANERLLAVVESGVGGQSLLTQFRIDEDGNLTKAVSTPTAGAANGVVIVSER